MHRVVLAALALSACRVEDPFVCESDAQCRRDGKPAGTCEASNNCSFPDIDCTSGRRYDTLAELSNQCVLDDDQDMIADDGDNCVGVANADQYDEDNDGLGDVCDPCPPFSDNRDDDDDGVGNLCDPRPGITGDTLVYFEGFHTPLSNAWSVVGNAIIENDGLTLQGDNVATLPPAIAGNGALLAGVELAQTPTTGAWLGVPFAPAAPGPFCTLTMTDLELRSGTTLVGTTAFNAKLDTTYTLEIRRDGTQYYCGARVSPSATTAEVSGTATAPSTTNVSVGTDATARFAWVLLVES